MVATKIPTHQSLFFRFRRPIHANRFADSRESLDSRESFQGSRTEPLFCESRCGGGGLKIANRRFEAIRANCSHIIKIGFLFTGGKSTSTQNKKSSSEQVFLNNCCCAPNSCHREGAKSSCELFEKVRVKAVFFGISGFWVDFCASIFSANRFARIAPIRVANRRAI